MLQNLKVHSLDFFTQSSAFSCLKNIAKDKYQLQSYLYMEYMEGSLIPVKQDKKEQCRQMGEVRREQQGDQGKTHQLQK